MDRRWNEADGLDRNGASIRFGCGKAGCKKREDEMKSGLAGQRNGNEGLLFPRGSTRLFCQTSVSEHTVFREVTSGIRKRSERMRRMCRGTREKTFKKRKNPFYGVERVVSRSVLIWQVSVSSNKSITFSKCNYR